MDTDIASGYPQPGELIDDKYRIERLLGAGGMGAVLEATHLLRRAPVALKFMSPRLVNDPAVVERFLNEGVAASRINNEHVVSVLDVSKLATGLPYLVMEYLEGVDLAHLLAREGGPGLADVPRCVHFVLQVLRGLQVAHHAGIVHRDLKPANCLVVQRDGEPDFLKIVDFGISKLKAEPLNLTQVGSALGTPLYVSPEQARDPASVDARGDLYSVSVILYELLSGRTPFYPASGQLSELFMQLATAQPRSLDSIRNDLPEGLDAAIQKGLEKSRDDRYRSAAEMAAALGPFSDSRSDRVLRQLVQRSTVNPGGIPSPLPPKPAPAPTRVAEAAPVATVRLPESNAGTPQPWLTALAPHETAPALSGPSFLHRRQTELKIGVPVLLLLALAMALLSRQAAERARPAAEGISDRLERASTSSPDETTQPALSGHTPVIRPVRPTLDESSPASSTRSSSAPGTRVRQQGAGGSAERSGSAAPEAEPQGELADPKAAPASRGAQPSKPQQQRRKPRLKQIGIEE